MPSSFSTSCARRRAISSARSRRRASTCSLLKSGVKRSPFLSESHVGTLGCRAVAVAVVSDTTGYLPRELAEANQITLVSLYMVFGGERTVRESEITDYEAFFEELRGAEQLPTTSQP